MDTMQPWRKNISQSGQIIRIIYGAIKMQMHGPHPKLIKSEESLAVKPGNLHV